MKKNLLLQALLLLSLTAANAQGDNKEIVIHPIPSNQSSRTVSPK